MNGDVPSHARGSRPEIAIGTGSRALAPVFPLALRNLLNTFDGMAELLQTALRGGDVLNGYLLAAGLNQIAEDHLHADPWNLGRASARLECIGGPAGKLGAELVRRTAIPASALRRVKGANRRLALWQGGLAKEVQALATQVVGSSPAAAFDRVKENLETLLSRVGDLPPSVRSTVVRLPSCFRSFDQRPEDASALARRVLDVHADCVQGVVVVGVRTSGSYLAPLCAAALEVEGKCDVSFLTVRPGHPFLPAEQGRLKAFVGRGALVLVVDDPPTSGETLERAASQLADAGVLPDRLSLMLALAGPLSSLPAKLARLQGVYLPFSEWSVHELLRPEAVIESFAALVAPASDVVELRRLRDIEPPRARAHVYGHYEVGLIESATGHRWDEQLLVKGAGLGYFGDHALAVDSALRQYLPRLHGVRDGLVYRQWLPAERRIRLTDDHLDLLAREMAGYVHARHKALPVGADASRQMFGQGAAWEVAANLFSRVFGPAWFIARVPFIDPIVRRILAVDQPSVVDGSTRLSHWFAEEGGGDSLCKVDADERAFSHTDLYSYDPVFDLAGLVTEGGGPCVADLARGAYEKLSGGRVGAERWLVHTLVHLWDRQRTGTVDDLSVQRSSARAMQNYLASVYMADLAVPVAGGLCAIDIDGVLETDVLGFPTGAPAGMSSLRALTRHGYRPLLVTGRSLGEVRERCEIYRLAGGVAEYGSVAYDHVQQTTRILVPDDALTLLERLRQAPSPGSSSMTATDGRCAPRWSTMVGEGNASMRRRSIACCRLWASALVSTCSPAGRRPTSWPLGSTRARAWPFSPRTCGPSRLPAGRWPSWPSGTALPIYPCSPTRRWPWPRGTPTRRCGVPGYASFDGTTRPDWLRRLGDSSVIPPAVVPSASYRRCRPKPGCCSLCSRPARTGCEDSPWG